GARGLDVRPERRLVAREQREPRVQQAQLQVLAQEERLRRRKDRRVRPLHVFDAHGLLQLGKEVRTESLPEPALAFLRDCCRLRRPRLLRERQRVGGGDELVELDRETGDVRAGRGLQALDIARQHLAQRRELRAIRAREPRVGGLQRDQRCAHVAGELQLLRGDRQYLLDLREHPFVAAARQLLIQGLERYLLTLRFGELDLEL